MHRQLSKSGYSGIVSLSMLLLLFINPAAAGSLPQPSGRVILTVSGNIGNTNQAGKAVFDRAMLEQLGMQVLFTHSDWTDGRSRFEGILFSKLLEVVDARGTLARSIAINDYAVEIPLSEIKKYPVMLALKLDAQYLRIRDKGPLWVVYPWDDHAELDNERTRQRSIWQLKSIEIR